MQFNPTTDLHYGVLFSLRFADTFLGLSLDDRVVSLSQFNCNALFVIVPLKRTSPQYQLKGKFKSSYDSSAVLSDDQRKNLILQKCHQGIDQLDCFISEQIEQENKSQGRGITFGQSFHIQHFNTAKYLGYKNAQSQKGNQSLLQLTAQDQPNQRTTFKITHRYQYQTKISKYPRFQEDFGISTLVGKTKEGFLMAVTQKSQTFFYLGLKSQSYFRFHLYNEYRPLTEMKISFGDFIWLYHTETKSLLSVSEELVPEFVSCHVQGKLRPLSSVWMLQNSSQASKGGKVNYSMSSRLLNLKTGMYLSCRESKEKKWQVSLSKQREEYSKFIFSRIDKFDTDELNRQSYFYIKNTGLNLFLGQEEALIERLPRAHFLQSISIKDLFRAQRLSYVSVWENNKVIKMRQMMVWFIQNLQTLLEQQDTASLRSLQKMLNQFIVYTYNTQSLQQIIGNISSSSGDSITLKLFHNGLVQIVSSLLHRLSELYSLNQTIVSGLVSALFKIIKNVASRGVREKNAFSEYILILCRFIGKGVNCQSALKQIISKNLNLKQDINRYRSNNLDIFGMFFQAFRDSKERKDSLIEFIVEAIQEEGQGISINQLIVNQYLFKRDYFLRFFEPIVSQKQKILITSTKIPLEEYVQQPKAFRQLYNLLLVLSKLSTGRNYQSMASIKNIFNYQSLIHYIGMQDLSRNLKALLLNILINVFIDSSPRFQMADDQLVFVLHEKKNKTLQESLQQQVQDELLDKQPKALQLQARQIRTSPRQKVQEGQILKDLTQVMAQFIKLQIEMDNLTLSFVNLLELQLKFRILTVIPKENQTQSVLSLLDYLLLLLLQNRQEDLRNKQQNQFYEKTQQKAILRLLGERQIKKQKGLNYRKLVQEQAYKLQQSMYYITALSARKRTLIYLQSLKFVDIFASQFFQSSIKEKLLELLMLVFHNIVIQNLHQFVKMFVLQSETKNGQLQTDFKFWLPQLLCGKAVQIDRKKKYPQIFQLQSRILNNSPFFQIVLKSFMDQKNYKAKRQSALLIFKMFARRRYFLRLLSNVQIFSDPKQVQLFEYLKEQFVQLKHLLQTCQVWFFQQAVNEKDLKFTTSRQTINCLIRLVFSLYKSYQVRDLKVMQGFDQNKLFNFRTSKYTNVSYQRQNLIRSVGFHIQLIKFLEESLFFFQKLKFSKSQRSRRVGKLLFFHSFQFLHGFILNNNQINKKYFREKVNAIIRYTNLQQIGQSSLIGELYKDNAQFIKIVPMSLINSVFKKLTQDSPQYNPKLLNLISTIITFRAQIYLPNLNIILQKLAKPNVVQKLFFLRKNNYYLQGAPPFPIEDKKDRKRLFAGMSKYLFDLDFMHIISGLVPFLYHSTLINLLLLIYTKYHQGQNLLRPKIMSIVKMNYVFYILSKSDCFTKFGQKGKLTLIVKIHLIKLVMTVHLKQPQIITGLHENNYFRYFLKLLERALDNFQKKNIKKSQKRAEMYSQVFSQFDYYKSDFEQYDAITFSQYLNTHLRPMLQLIANQNNITLPILSKFPQPTHQVQFEADRSQQHSYLLTLELPLKGLTNPQLQEGVEWRRKILGIIFHSDIQKLVDQQEQHFMQCILTLKQKNFHLNYLQSLVNYETCSAKHRLQSKQFFRQLISFFFQAINSYLANTTQQFDLLILNKILKFILKVIRREHMLKDQLVNILQQNFINQTVKLFSWHSFTLKNRRLEKFYLRTLQIFTLMVSTNDSQKMFYQILISKNSTETPTQNFFVFLKEIIFDSIQTIQATSPDVIFNQCFSQIKYSYKKSSQNTPVEIVMKFITALCENNEGLPFNDFFRFQNNFIVTTDFMAVGLKFLKTLILKQGEVRMRIVDVRLIKVICQNLISFVQGPNLKNQLSLAESSLSEVVFEVMKLQDLPKQLPCQEQIKQVCKQIQQHFERFNQQLKDQFSIEKDKFFYFNKKFFNQVKLHLTKCLTAISQGDNALTLYKIKSFFPLEYLIINIIWVYDLFQVEEKLLYKQGLLEETAEKDIIYEAREGCLRELVLQLGFKLYPFVQKYNNMMKLQTDQKGDDEPEGYIKVISQFFNRLNSKKADQPLDEFQEQVANYERIYKGACQFFQQYSIHVQIQLKDKIFSHYFPKLPLCAYLSQQMKTSVKEGATMSNVQKITFFFQRMKEISDQILLENKVRGLVGGYCLNGLPLHQTILVLALLQMVFLMTFTSGNAPFSLDFMQTYIVFDTIDSPMAYLVLINQILILLLGLTKIANMVVYKFPLALLKAQHLVILINKERRFKSQSELGLPQKLPIYLKGVCNKQLFYQIIYNILVLFTIANPFFSTLLLVDLFTRRYSLIFMITNALLQPWRLLLVILFIWMMINYVFSFVYWGYFQETFNGDVCTSILGCFEFMFDQTYRGDSGFLSSNTYSYFAADPDPIWQPSFVLITDFVYIVVVLKLVKQLFGGTVIDTFSAMREQQSELVRELGRKCFICGLERVVLDIENQGYEKHTVQNHNLWNYIFLLAYLKRKDQRDYTTLERYFYQACRSLKNQCLPQMNSVFIQRSKELTSHQRQPGKVQMMQESVKGMRRQLEEVVRQLGQ